MFKDFIKKITPMFQGIILPIGKIHWKTKKELSPEDKQKIMDLLKDNYFIILSRRTNHLSTYFVSLAEFITRKKFAYWSHALMNLEDEVTSEIDFRLMEATGTGVHYSTFAEVFDVQATVLLKPKSMDITEWTQTLDDAKAQLGKEYDTLLDIYDSSKLSCIEMVRKILMGNPNYSSDFANFEKMIAEIDNVTPQMLYDCSDFEIVLEIRK